MIVLYIIVFLRLREREKARLLRQTRGKRIVENDLISTALMSGTKIARELGHHFKLKADKMLLELSSLQVCRSPFFDCSVRRDPELSCKVDLWRFSKILFHQWISQPNSELYSLFSRIFNFSIFLPFFHVKNGEKPFLPFFSNGTHF